MVVDHEALTTSLHVLLAAVDLPPDVPEQEVLRRMGEVLTAATDVLEVDSVGLMLLDEHDVLRVVGVTDEAGAALEAGQQQLDLGPAIDTMRTGATVAVDDLAESSTYARLWTWLRTRSNGSAHSAGGVVRAVVSAAVRARGEVVGNLNGICREPRNWSGAQIRAVEAYASLVGVLLRLGVPADAAVGTGLAGLGERGSARP